jgi:two-component system sensor histidine kinase MprB
VVDSDGQVLLTLTDDFELPSDSEVLEAALVAPVLQDATGPDGGVRVVTVAGPGETFVQFARSLEEVESVLDDLQSRVLLIGGLAISVAAAVAWFASARTLRPVSELTEAAGRVAATGDLSQPIAGSGSDEVGRLATSFRTMLGALAASRQQQHRLVMDASHELRTPLTSLRTNVDVLRRGHDLSDEDRDALVHDLDTELSELSDLMAELVDLAADVRDDEAPQPLRLADLVEEVADRTRRRTERDIHVDVQNQVTLEGRPEALTRAIRNLVDNAAKFSPDDTPIRIVIDGGAVVVHDQGPGIPSGDREVVFERFHRLDATRGRPGSGLGLSIVRQVADAHGGSAWADASPDGGAAVGFRVPTVDD